MADEKLTRAPLTKDNSALRREEYEMPNARSGISSMVQDMLERGGVQRIIIEVGHPLRVDRWVAKDAVDAAMDSDMPVPDSAGLNLYRVAISEDGELEEVELPDESVDYPPVTLLLHAFQQIGERGNKSLAIYANNEKGFRRWLKLQKGFFLKTVFGVEVRFQNDVPEDTIILVSGQYDIDEPGRLYSVCIRTGAKKELSYVGEPERVIAPPGDFLPPPDRSGGGGAGKS